MTMPTLQITCKQCFASVTLPPGDHSDVHIALSCGCCTGAHHHGQAASACPRTHPGPCYNPPDAPERPDGCTVCRPVIIFPVAGVPSAAITVPAQG